MSIKEKLLKLLEENENKYVSGEALSVSLGVTRTAVWKAVNKLKDEGYPIDSVKNCGYKLNCNADVMEESDISALVTAQGVTVTAKRHVSSTNTVLREQAEKGAEHGSVFVASSQSAGRGRMGRSFFSPDDTGIYMSILLRPSFDAEKASLITCAAAVAVCKAIEKVCGADVRIKWVNDIFLGGKKVCGILTEASFSMESGKLEYAVLGIGINVYKPEGGFPCEIESIAGYIAEKREKKLRSRLTAQIINEFFSIYGEYEAFDFVDEYKARSFVIGKKVKIIRGDTVKNATVTDIDGKCRLLVEYENGEKDALSSGEISIRF
ncbi:MAG: biotin--[acetyl-CoA-carboxylase] ligase [Ruminococcaceae bacterium]|nr:biotin--[acetyl-CoA-carboxylase] ligase [Oscillospiraceae bacterium]